MYTSEVKRRGKKNEINHRCRRRRKTTLQNIVVVDNDVILFVYLFLRQLMRVEQKELLLRNKEREEEKATTTTNYSMKVCMCRTHTDKKSNKQSTYTHTRIHFSQYTNTFDEFNKLFLNRIKTKKKRCYQ